MQALRYPEFGRLEMARVQPPAAAPDEVVIQVAACGICGSEIESFKNRSPRRQPPLVMGHEFCGTVVERGPAATAWQIGQKVISHSTVHCGTCAMCRRGRPNLCSRRQIFGMHRPGAFAERVSVPERCLIPWPEGLAPGEASMSEPLANGVHIVNLTRHLPIKTALVIGAGPIGLLCQLAFQALRGTRMFVSEPNSLRLKAAEERGATHLRQMPPGEWAENALRATDGEGFDLVIDAVGAQSTRLQSIASVSPGGAAVWIGLHEDPTTVSAYSVILPEKQVFGTYSATIPELAEAANLLATKRVDVGRVIEPHPLDDGVNAFDRASQGKNIKAVLLPS